MPCVVDCRRCQRTSVRAGGVRGLRVIPYYCGKCGVRISPEDARFGQACEDARTHFCPTCVVEYGLSVEGSDSVELAADATRSARNESTGAAVDLTRKQRVTSRRRIRSVHSERSPKTPVRPVRPVRAAAARSSPLLLVLGLGIGGLIAGGGVYVMTRSDPALAPAGAVAASRSPAATAKISPGDAPTAIASSG